MKILVLDNYDSFTYNLVHTLEKFTTEKVNVFRNDEITLEDIAKYDKIVLSPGPGIPDEAGIIKQLIKEYSVTKSILGVCLGMQAIAEVFGCKLINLENVFHGVATQMKIIKTNEIIFANIPQIFYAGRYHSWVVSKENFSKCLTITCEDTDGQIMGISHNNLDVKGLQFHPESVMTPLGEKIIYNWLNS